MNQKRQPSGVPVGGQFAENNHDEANGSLSLSDEEYNKTGTFLYPPYPRSAQQLISFYETTHIGDETLTKFADAYGDARLRWAAPLVEKADEKYKRMYGANTDRASEEHWKYIDELEDQHPTHMNPLFARDIAKAVQLYRFAGVLDETEANSVYRHKITQVNGKQKSVQELAERYLAGQYDGDLI